MSLSRTANLVALCLVLLTFLVPGAASARMDEPAGILATATVVAESGSVYSSGPAVSLAVYVANVQKLGAWTIAIPYDPAVIKAVGWQRSPAFDVGFCNPTADTDGDFKVDAVFCNGLSLAGVSTGATPIAMASIAWQATAPVTVEMPVALHVQLLTFTDSDDKPLDAVGQDAKITVLPPRFQKRILLPLIRR